MANIDWESESRLCKRVGATRVDVPAVPKPTEGASSDQTLGAESVRVSLVEVMARKWWFPCGGVYTIRDAAGVVVYLGFTNAPLGARLRLATLRRPVATWAECDYGLWTVTLRRGTEDDMRRLRTELRPGLMRGAGGPVTVRSVGAELRVEADALDGRGLKDAADAVRRVADRFTR